MCGIITIMSSPRSRETLSPVNSRRSSGMLERPGNAGHLLGVLLVDQAAEQVDFAFMHADVVLHLALSDDRLVDAAEVDVAGDGRDVEVDVHGDVAVVVHVRQQFHVHADVDEVELRVDQRVDADAADAGLEAAGGGRLALADLQGGFDAVHRAELGRLQDLGLGIGSASACSSALGSVIEKSELESWPRFESGIGCGGRCRCS